MILRDDVVLFAPVLIATLALILRRRLWLRYLSVFMLLFLFTLFVIHGLGNVARYTPQPYSGVMERKVIYADAWWVGAIATQKHVTGYLPYLDLWYAALAVLALVPARKEQDSPQEDDGENDDNQ